VRSLCTMKPVSTRIGPSGPSTVWVWVCPPRRVSASYKVTWFSRLRRYAEVSPDTPDPMTAMRLMWRKLESSTTFVKGLSKVGMRHMVTG